MRRRYKVFHLISGYVRTKTPNQCRSHHQKMMYRYGNLQEIIRNMKINEEDQKDLNLNRSQPSSNKNMIHNGIFMSDQKLL